MKPLAATVLALALLAAPLAVEAQQAGRVPRIGALWLGSPLSQAEIQGLPLARGLRELGWILGQNAVIEWRYAEGKPERFPDLAADLVRLKVDVIVSAEEAALIAAKRVTGSIPIVMVGAADPVGLGLVEGLARPGGNVTGVAWDTGTELVGKQVELLKTMVPTASRLALLLGATGGVDRWDAWRDAARTLGLELRRFDVRDATELDGAFAAIRQWRADILRVGAGLYPYRRQIIEVVARHRLPAIYLHRGWVEEGGFFSYALDFADMGRRAAGFVDRILRGAKPADLPVEQPTKFELVVNLKTAKALGLTIPPSVLARADEVIQ